MSEYFLSQIFPSDKYSLAQIDALLQREGITRDAHLDYICALRDGDDEIIATGSCFGATLRCFAVSSGHQGEGLLNEIISHLVQGQYARGKRTCSCIPRKHPPGFSPVWAFTRLPGWMGHWYSWRTGEAASPIT